MSKSLALASLLASTHGFRDSGGCCAVQSQWKQITCSGFCTESSHGTMSMAFGSPEFWNCLLKTPLCVLLVIKLSPSRLVPWDIEWEEGWKEKSRLGDPVLLVLNHSWSPVFCSSHFRIICWELSEQNYKEHPSALEGEQLARLCTHLFSLLHGKRSLSLWLHFRTVLCIDIIIHAWSRKCYLQNNRLHLIKFSKLHWYTFHIILFWVTD